MTDALASVIFIVIVNKLLPNVSKFVIMAVLWIKEYLYSSAVKTC